MSSLSESRTPAPAPAPPPARDAPSYRRVLRVPGAARLYAASLWGRLSYGTVFLALMLAITGTTGSYTLAGACSALFALASTGLAALRAGFVDRHGARRALPPMAALYASLLATLAVATWRPGTPKSSLLLLCMAAGACTPPLGPTMRSLWAGLIDDPPLRRRAFALDTVSEEVLYVTGPLLAGGLAAWINPAAGLALSALLVLTGTFALAKLLPGRDPASPAAAPRRASRGPRPRRPRIDLLTGAVPISAATGSTLAALSLLTVAYAQRHHNPDSVAWVEAAQSVGSALGGLAYGAVRWRLSARRQMLGLACALGFVVAAAGTASGIWLLAVVVGVSGLFVSPTITMTYVVADEAASAERRIQSGTLVNSAYNAGSSLGSSGAGLLLGGCPLSLCFVFAALPAWLAVAGEAVAGRHRRSGADGLADGPTDGPTDGADNEQRAWIPR